MAGVVGGGMRIAGGRDKRWRLLHMRTGHGVAGEHTRGTRVAGGWGGMGWDGTTAQGRAVVAPMRRGGRNCGKPLWGRKGTESFNSTVAPPLSGTPAGAPARWATPWARTPTWPTCCCASPSWTRGTSSSSPATAWRTTSIQSSARWRGTRWGRGRAAGGRGCMLPGQAGNRLLHHRCGYGVLVHMPPWGGVHRRI